MGNPWIAALMALFLWWFSTGAILLAVRAADLRGARVSRLTTWAALPVLAVGIWAFQHSLPLVSVWGAYMAFLSVLAIWGWIELAFLTGVITGPNTYELPEGTQEFERFIRAWGTIAWHEITLFAILLLVLYFGWGAENITGLWTFAVLYFARVSAKLNLYCGVPRINTEFIPSALSHLPSHFRIARLNWLFPVSITALTFAVSCWLERLWASQTTGEAAGFALLAAITTLALVEHWVMVLPLPDAKLWRWMLPTPKPSPSKRHEPEGNHGF